MTAELWPFVPGLGISEALAWDTQIIAGRGDEQRIARRIFPRASMIAPHVFRAIGGPARLPALAEAEAILRSAGAADLQVPAWPEAAALGAVAATDVALAFDTSSGDWAVGGAVGLVDPASRRVVASATVSALRADGLDLDAGAGVDLPRARVVPLRPARLGVPASGAAGVDRTVALTLEATWRDPPRLQADAADQLDGSDVLADLGRAPEGEERGWGLPVQITGGPGGPDAQIATRDVFEARGALSYIDTGADRWARRRWLFGRCGRQRAFWIVPRRKALRIAEGLSGYATEIALDAPDRPDQLVGRAIQWGTGASMVRRVLGALTIDGAVARYQIAALAGVGAASGTAAHELRRWRLDSDSVEIRHDPAGVQRMTLPIVEVPR